MTDDVQPVSTPVEDVPTTTQDTVNFTITDAVDLPVPEGNTHDEIGLITKTPDQIMANSENFPRMADSSYRVLGNDWSEAVAYSLHARLTTNTFVSQLNNSDNHYVQKIRHNELPIALQKIGFNDTSEDAKLSGPAAIYQMQSLLGTGSTFTLPLWTSGIWITLRNPSEADLLVLEEAIANEKTVLGRESRGMVYSNTSVYLAKHLFSFILNHIYDCSIKDWQNVNLAKYVRITDLYPLIHLLACTIYPRGYKYRSACFNTDPEQCGGTTTSMLNLVKLFWNNDRAITADQRDFMAISSKKRTIVEIEAYQTLTNASKGRIVKDVHKSFAIELKVPTVEQYVQSGEEWISAIANSVNAALNKDTPTAQKEKLIRKQARLSVIREYSHCISRIIFVDTDRYVDDTGSINELAEVMSADETVTSNFIKAVNTYLEEMTVTIIAIPNYNCPKCGKAHAPEENVKHNLLVPLDTLNLFFTLKDLRISRAR